MTTPSTPSGNPVNVSWHASMEARVRALEAASAAHRGAEPGLERRIAATEREIIALRDLIRDRDDEYTKRFDKITRTIGWAAGALSVLVFFAQVVWPMTREAHPTVIQVVPKTVHEAPAEPDSR